MVFSEKENLGKFSFSLVHLGFLMAQGDPADKDAQKAIQTLSQALQKIDLESRLIDNMRHFENTFLSHPQKLKIYEILLKTLAEVQRSRKSLCHRSLGDAGCEDKALSWRQEVELQQGAWTAFALLLGAVVASTDTCEKWVRHYGVRIGVYLQMLVDLKKMRSSGREPAAWMQPSCQNSTQFQKVSQQVSHELSTMLIQLRMDLSDRSLAYQFLNHFGLEWTEMQEEQQAH